MLKIDLLQIWKPHVEACEFETRYFGGSMFLLFQINFQHKKYQ